MTIPPLKVFVPPKVTLPPAVMPLVAPKMAPDKVNVLAEAFVISKPPLMVIDAEMVSPLLVDNCRSEAWPGVLSSVRVPPLPVRLKAAAPPEEPIFKRQW